MTKHNPTQNIRRSLKLSVLALVAGSALWLSGCSDARGRASVMMKFPDCEVAMVPDRSGEWIIRKPDGSVWYAIAEGANEADPKRVYNITEIISKP